MLAIRTRYMSATNRFQSRILASDAEGNQAHVSYDDALSSEANHSAAAQKLMTKLNYTNKLVSGEFGNDMFWVMLPRETASEAPTSNTVDVMKLRFFRNKNFVKRDCEATNIVACIAPNPPSDTWVEVESNALTGLYKLHTEAGVTYYGWL